jgi:hypothetical protein
VGVELVDERDIERPVRACAAHVHRLSAPAHDDDAWQVCV